MRWKTILNTARKKVYELWHKDKYVLSLTYNDAAGTARIESSDEKRLFIIRKEGILKNKTVLINEYGFQVGKLGYENKENFIEFDGERFFYTIKNNGHAELIIYKVTPEQPLLVCDLSAVPGNVNPITLKPGEALAKTSDVVSLLTSLCWLLFQPFAKIKATELTVG
jgi:hypothetical protein